MLASFSDLVVGDNFSRIVFCGSGFSSSGSGRLVGAATADATIATLSVQTRRSASHTKPLPSLVPSTSDDIGGLIIKLLDLD